MYLKLILLSTIIFFNGFTSNVLTNPKRNIPDYHHALLSEWKETTNEHDVQEIEGIFIRLRKEIKGLEKVKFRRLYEGKFDHQVILKFSTKQALKEYENHPLHDSLQVLAKAKVKHLEYYNYWE